MFKLQRRYNVENTASYSQGLLDVGSEESQMWTIHDDMITFLQPCLEIVNKFNNGMKLSLMQSGYCEINSNL